jgi:hypothetical protein
MNQRIKELARDAGLLVHNPESVPTKLEKFAELLVLKCAEIADTAEPFLASDLIKEHFGVKE